MLACRDLTGSPRILRSDEIIDDYPDLEHDELLAAPARLPHRLVAAVADADERVVVGKDRDFRDSHPLHGTPRRLPIVATGNIANNELLTLFEKHLDTVVATLCEADLVELGPRQIIIQADRHDHG